MPVYGVKPDEVTMLFVFRACAQLDNAVAGDHAIGYVMKMGVPFTLKMCNSMIDMYVKCGLIGEAKRVFHDMSESSVVTWTVMLDGVVKWEGLDCGRAGFDEMPLRNEIAWTIMTKGYAENGFTREVFALLGEMVFISLFELNFATLCSILTGCAQSGDLMVGRWVHVFALKRMEEEMNAMVGTSLINKYAKRGRINMAFMVFQNMAS
ncbi:hypothetical protein Nepgr_024518 [Nepenthes gracilis]|uniref:Pentatricopeptide repeat-containing protein n=1 Tax=Nepenthes gracilis TaxID=150966 RepID=A0AAD3T4D3_NEPGR|nr:hypothetical protein Nepgr_024518 [Nepenthes gracilis]